MRVEEFLISSFVFPNVSGFKYLIKAIQIVKSDPNYSKNKHLYSKVAEFFEKTPQNVERGIRYIVDNKLTVEDYAKLGLTKKLTISEFIYYFATQGE